MDGQSFFSNLQSLITNLTIGRAFWMKTYCSDTHEIGVLNEGFELVRVSLWMAEGDATCPTVPLKSRSIGDSVRDRSQKAYSFPALWISGGWSPTRLTHATTSSSSTLPEDALP
jgi:hypothetical protein